jgi:hypothetical protein
MAHDHHRLRRRDNMSKIEETLILYFRQCLNRRYCSDVFATIELQVFEWSDKHDVAGYCRTERARVDRKEGKRVE